MGLSILSFCSRFVYAGSAQGNHGDTEHKARDHVEYKHSGIAFLKKLDHVVGEGGECCQSTAEACYPKQVCGLAKFPCLIEIAVKHADYNTSDHIGHECAQWKREVADRSSQLIRKEPQTSA
jgi:hypothetical protein